MNTTPLETSEPTDPMEHPSSESGDEPSSSETKHGGRNYWRFAAMIATSMTAMFALTYANSYRLGDVKWSETRFYMTFVMGAAMAVIMLGFMLGMYRSKKINAAIFVGSAVVFSLALWLVRSQETVQDQSYMRAMIPHHSIAIMTSERAHLRDPRVRELAKDIIVAQRREIAEMKYLIADIERNGVRTEQRMPRDLQPAQPSPATENVQ